MSKAQSNRKASISEAQPKQLGIPFVLEASADQKIVFTVFWKAQPSKECYLRCFRMLGRARSLYSHCFRRFSKAEYTIYGVFAVYFNLFSVSVMRPLSRSSYGICCVLEGPADQSMLFTLFSKDRPSKSNVFSKAQPSIYMFSVFLMFSMFSSTIVFTVFSMCIFMFSVFQCFGRRLMHRTYY